MSGISPWPSGQIRPMIFEVYDDSGQLVPLTGLVPSACVFQVYDWQGKTVVLTGTGTFSIPNASGFISYLPATTDSATPGTYLVRVKAGSLGSTDFIPWVVQA